MKTYQLDTTKLKQSLTNEDLDLIALLIPSHNNKVQIFYNYFSQSTNEEIKSIAQQHNTTTQQIKKVVFKIKNCLPIDKKYL